MKKNLNIVAEIFSDTIKGCNYQSHSSPFTRAAVAKEKHHVYSFQCDAFSEYDFVDTANPAPGRPPTHPPIYSCSFGKDASTSHLLAMAGEDGHICVIDTSIHTSDGTVTPSSVHNVHKNAVMDLSWVPGTDELVSGGGDKTAVVWQLRAGRLHPLLKLLGHTRSIKAVHVNPYDPVVFATGSRDSNIIIWDRRCSPNHRADEIVPAHPCLASVSSPRYRGSPAVAAMSGPHNNGVTSLLFTGQHTLLSAGASDGLLKVWDLRKSHAFMRSAPLPQHTLQQPPTSCRGGFSWLTAPHHSHYVYALAMDNNIYAYHLAMPSTAPVCWYSGSMNLSYYVKASVSACGRFLVSGSTDNRALVWLTAQPGAPVAQLSGHHGEVTAVDWGRDKIVTCADDYKQRIYHLKRTDYDNLDENLLLRGRAEPVDQEVLHRCQQTVDLSLRKTELLEENTAGGSSGFSSSVKSSLPPIPKTPSASRTCATNKNSKTPIRSNTPLPASDAGSSREELLPSTPRQPRLPLHSPMVESAANTPQTPSSVDRSVSILHWLSSAKKTPKRVEATPRQESTAGCVSASKRAGIKRKLTEVMEDPNEDAENAIAGSFAAKKPPISPTKNVLSSIAEENYSSFAAKMLKYEKGKEKDLENKVPAHNSNLETMLGISDSVQPFETSLLDSLMNSSFRSSFGETKKAYDVKDNGSGNKKSEKDSNARFVENNTLVSQKIILLETPNKSIQLGNSCTPTANKTPSAIRTPARTVFESPTANLPNFVKDGASPRTRPVPVFQDKLQTNWLSSISLQRKLKFGKTPDKKNTREDSATKKTKRKPVSKSSKLSKKFLKIVALADSPMREADKSLKNMTQTKLNFQQ